MVWGQVLHSQWIVLSFMKVKKAYESCIKVMKAYESL